MSEPHLLLPQPLRDEVAAYLEPRAADVDAGGTDVRPALAFLHARALRDGPSDPDPDLARVAATIATAAWSDLSTAFSLWCHRMVLEYLVLAPPDLPARRELLPALLRLEEVGSTGLASAMAHVVFGARLPVTARRVGGVLVLSGKVRWASNLFAPAFVLVTASAGADGGPAIAVALRGDAPGLRVDRCPELLALQATASSSIAVDDVRIRPDEVLASDLAPFVRRVRPTFLILQSAFCWGLARRALDEVSAAIAPGSVLDPDRLVLEDRAATVAGCIARATASRRSAEHHATDVRELVALRLEAARVATESVALELKALGSRAYARSSSTARRLREAAFLPIQAPTEAQLREELAALAIAP